MVPFLQSQVQQLTFADGLSEASRKVANWLTGFVALLPNIIVATVVLIIMIAFAWGLSYGLRASLARRGRRDLASIFEGLVFWGIVVFAILVSLTIILPSLNPGDLVASLGIGSIAIGFAFKDILQNWLAGVLLLLRQPFRRGDQIQIGDHEGTVRSITSRAVYLKTYDGRRVIIPNSEVYSSALLVHTAYPSRRVWLDLTVGYDYDFRTICSIISGEISRIPGILQEPEPQIMAWDLGSTSLRLRLRWWIEPQRSQEVLTRSMLVQAIKEAFQTNGIDPTDPQLVFYHEAGEQILNSGRDDGRDPDRREVRSLHRAGSIEAAKPGPEPAPVIINVNDPEDEKPQPEQTATDDTLDSAVAKRSIT